MAPPENATSSMSINGEKQKNLDQEIRELISALTNRIKHTQKSSSNSNNNVDEEDDDNGVSIITLAGSNLGATMRDEKPAQAQGVEQDDDFAPTYVNSNFQAINNSIMLGGSYETNDPGVHLDITDCVERDPSRGKKVLKNEGGSSKTDVQQIETN
ncbi:hypothetical protein ACJIZ3_009617 [Penstemon smallii]|uniref:Uncharacterized protein n=1 Tax=Penstemon smallii TaxID=265156 RepID=A0ABD3TE44_9LAMI